MPRTFCCGIKRGIEILVYQSLIFSYSFSYSNRVRPSGSQTTAAALLRFCVNASWQNELLVQGGKSIMHARYYRTLVVTEQLPTKVQGLFVSTKCKFVVQRGDSELLTRHHSDRDSKDTFKQVSSVSNCTNWGWHASACMWSFCSFLN